jgi:hypothetical protein
MKRLILLCLILIAVGIPSGSAQVLRTVRLYDAFTDIARSCAKVRDVKELKRTPLFDNAPFLRLRPGDALVEAKEDPEGWMGKGYPDLNRTDTYLRSGGEYYRLWTTKENDKLLLSPAFHAGGYCLLFDWEFNLATAEAPRLKHCVICCLHITSHRSPRRNTGPLSRRFGRSFPKSRSAMRPRLLNWLSHASSPSPHRSSWSLPA